MSREPAAHAVAKRTRRSILKGMLGAGGLLLAGALGVGGRLWGLRARLTGKEPLPAEVPPGPVEPGALTTLLAATTALLGVEVDLGRYEAFFIYRAEYLSGHRGLYQRFAARLDAEAQAAAGHDFAGLDAATARRVLDRVIPPGPQGWRGKLRLALEGSEPVAFYRHIALDVLTLFARTDALVHLGYDSWPGAPRGLERYRQPLPPPPSGSEPQ